MAVPLETEVVRRTFREWLLSNSQGVSSKHNLSQNFG